MTGTKQGPGPVAGPNEPQQIPEDILARLAGDAAHDFPEDATIGENVIPEHATIGEGTDIRLSQWPLADPDRGPVVDASMLPRVQRSRPAGEEPRAGRAETSAQRKLREIERNYDRDARWSRSRRGSWRRRANPLPQQEPDGSPERAPLDL